ncbi:otoraplin-like [Acipenser ruthenus]|uniref:otoraplin-like n=1 Tax=Acipenser ruthenus TaxID=7906 RepID=UPI00145BA4B0|nr:otoraplin-like [Acipenser ruthenus]
MRPPKRICRGVRFSLHAHHAGASELQLRRTTQLTHQRPASLQGSLVRGEPSSEANYLAKAEDDYIAVDCRFINIRRGPLIYIYSKLVPERAGELWFGSVYSDHFVDQMGVLGYFPSNLVRESCFQRGEDGHYDN